MICCHIYFWCNHNGIPTFLPCINLICTFQCMQAFWALMYVYFFVSQLNYSQIFCATYCLVFIYILNGLFSCLLVLYWFYFSSFPLLINLYNTFPYFLLFFSASILFCVFTEYIEQISIKGDAKKMKIINYPKHYYCFISFLALML